MGNDCATGVVFTRNPSNGKNEIYGEYLINAQGEDVVAGTRTPNYITKKANKDSNSKGKSMEEAMPKVYVQLKKTLKLLEKFYKDHGFPDAKVIASLGGLKDIKLKSSWSQVYLPKNPKIIPT